jgi:hypothetical protein
MPRKLSGHDIEEVGRFVISFPASSFPPSKIKDAFLSCPESIRGILVATIAPRIYQGSTISVLSWQCIEQA